MTTRSPSASVRRTRSRSAARLGVLGQLPGRLLLDVAVQAPHALPDVVEGRRQLDAVDALRDVLGQALEVGDERGVDVDVGHDPVAVAADHRQRAAGEVAELVGELGLVALLEGRGGDRAVLAEGDVAQEVVAQGVGAEAIDDLEGVEHVAQRLAHLLAVHQEVAVDEDVLGQREVGGHQHRRPEDGVEAQDVLADDVVGRGPEPVGEVLALAREAQRRVVVQERVEPDVEHVARVPRHRHAPRELGARERDVLQAALDERERLVVADARRDEVGVLLVELLEALLEGAQREEVVLLAVALELDVVDRAPVALLDLVLDLEVGAARAVPALVQALVDVAVVVDALEDVLDAADVLGVRGADEEVDRGLELGRQRLEALGVAVGQLLGLEPLVLGRVGHRLAVLVGAGEEEHVVAALAVMARHHVGGDRRVRVPQVRSRVDVVDRRGDVEGALGGHEPRTLQGVRRTPAARRGTPRPTMAASAAQPNRGRRSRRHPPAPAVQQAADRQRRRDEGDGWIGRPGEAVPRGGGARRRRPRRSDRPRRRAGGRDSRSAEGSGRRTGGRESVWTRAVRQQQQGIDVAAAGGCAAGAEAQPPGRPEQAEGVAGRDAGAPARP